MFFFNFIYINKRSKNKYRKKPYFINLFYAGYFFGIGFFLTGSLDATYTISGASATEGYDARGVDVAAVL